MCDTCCRHHPPPQRLHHLHHLHHRPPPLSPPPPPTPLLKHHHLLHHHPLHHHHTATTITTTTSSTTTTTTTTTSSTTTYHHHHHHPPLISHQPCVHCATTTATVAVAVATGFVLAKERRGTSSAEVKENRNVGNLEARPFAPAAERQAHLRAAEPSPRGSGPPGAKRKRPLEEENHGQLCQLRLVYKKLSWSDSPKNALVQLNELRPGLQYRLVSQTGPVHAPVFCIAVDVNGLAFEGTGPTKKKAKMRAAELALKSFVQFPNAPQAHLAMGGLADPSADFTSDQAADFPDTLFKRFDPSPCAAAAGRALCTAASQREVLLLRHGRLLQHTLDLMVQAQQQQQQQQQRLGAAAAPEPEAAAKSPVALLNELRPALRYACLSERAEGRRPRGFVMVVRVDGRMFEGCGRSKKLAKNQAAQCALQALFNVPAAPAGRTGLKASRKTCPHLPQVSNRRTGRRGSYLWQPLCSPPGPVMI
ncbi:hypothetical protein CRUP_030015 [Coryphaenoides rupestris]|nr:hypothetical protein CRUP_030015 [Coryphaenoides rupestris]